MFTHIRASGKTAMQAHVHTHTHTHTMVMRPTGTALHGDQGPCGAAAPPSAMAPGFEPRGRVGAAVPPWHSPRPPLLLTPLAPSLMSGPIIQQLQAGQK